MPRLVRRKSPVERMKEYLNLGDWLLWLSEEFETRNWDSKQFATPLALGLNFVFLIARANSKHTGRGRHDDVFGDDSAASGWLSYIATFIVYVLSLFSTANAWYTFTRRRHYRLFESPIDLPQSTPSARRVRVDSSPISSSPLRFLANILGDSSAESRAHPDPTRDVWEIAIWDPIPSCLRLFCLFSPGHVLVYWLFLPTLASDPRPSVTVFTTLILEIVLSAQILFLQSSFSQQEKDSAIIHKEVMSEYDIKFVHPRLNPLMRDVGTQHGSADDDVAADSSEQVITYTPSIILKRGFRTNPNPNYAKHIDPDNVSSLSQRAFSPTPIFTPSAYNSREPTPFSGITPRPPIRQPQFRQSLSGALSTKTSTGDGGSLGVYSHANSPLKKTTSMYDIQTTGRRENPRNSYEMANQEQRERSTSPNKRQSDGARPLPGNSRTSFLDMGDNRRTSAPTAFVLKQRASGHESPHKRDIY